MPVHTVAHADLDKTIAKIEKSRSEEFVEMHARGPGAWIIITRPVVVKRETR